MQIPFIQSDITSVRVESDKGSSRSFERSESTHQPQTREREAGVAEERDLRVDSLLREDAPSEDALDVIGEGVGDQESQVSLVALMQQAMAVEEGTTESEEITNIEMIDMRELLEEDGDASVLNWVAFGGNAQEKELFSMNRDFAVAQQIDKYAQNQPQKSPRGAEEVRELLANMQGSALPESEEIIMPLVMPKESVSVNKSASAGMELTQLLKGEQKATERVGMKVDESLVNREMTLIVNQVRSESDMPKPLLDVAQKLEIQNAVRQALLQGGNTEIVQRAQFVVRTEEMGEIRLMLRPEHLGTVRVNLVVEDGRILGRIVVANEHVKAAFDDNMKDLRDAFLKSGFESDFDVDYQGSGEEQPKEHRGGYHSRRLREEASREYTSDILAYWQNQNG
ncbi:flagellar hook-length control protein FliK [Entomospira culicis]|uniref:Flagellar hook-length control protein FliK n=1 Tax=Entomospira culicis TaxID=2719989 RepID=A0A968KV19_9SPIO|nr:flagellar hook-length control protein FliK [Entomospira culicis]NIZ19385.1 flagellar hook-length control protein FliK [Entomospira culicis]NIZ69710.1 flagellar hook-length control protein FliK [Entomospira culicis]WDI36821.1 flagellar hook-length control protein FliK [Entomospira culicis]WDI38450.1 flagellar hook-length control protein FliK [Entomospira culicis]